MRFLKTKRFAKKAFRPAALSRHPREYLGEVASLVLYQLYGLDKNVEVTRQEKELRISGHGQIDYVLTCFEIANVLGQSPVKVAESVAAGIAKWIAQKNPPMQDKFKVQAVNGYVNFELSDEYISEAAYFVAHWLQKPQNRIAKNRNALVLTQGPILGDHPNAEYANQTLRFVLELYAGAGCKVKDSYIISDASELAASRVSTLLMGGGSSKKELDIEATKRRRSIRNAVAGISTEAELMNEVQKLREDFFRETEKHVGDTLYSKTDITSESKIASKVNEWLDKSVKKQGHILSDGRSKAVYYHINLGPLAALRSASGLLFEAAYLLYGLENMLEESRPAKDILVAIVPQKHHQLLYSHADMIVAGLSYKTFICIDAAQAQADMPKANGSEGLLSATYKEIAHILAGAVIHKAHTTESRAKLLALIDFPVELNSLAMQVRLLEVVSLVAADSKLAKSLKR